MLYKKKVFEILLKTVKFAPIWSYFDMQDLVLLFLANV